MTPEQSKKLKVSDRVTFNGDQADCGTVKENQAKYVKIKWDDGHQSLTGHKHMDRVELAAEKR